MNHKNNFLVIEVIISYNLISLLISKRYGTIILDNFSGKVYEKYYH